MTKKPKIQQRQETRSFKGIFSIVWLNQVICDNSSHARTLKFIPTGRHHPLFLYVNILRKNYAHLSCLELHSIFLYCRWIPAKMLDRLTSRTNVKLTGRRHHQGDIVKCFTSRKSSCLVVGIRRRSFH